MSDDIQDTLAEAGARQQDVPPAPKGAGVGFLIFVLGFFCGVPLAIFAPELISEYGGLMIAALVLVMVTIVSFLAILFILRHRIWFWLFRRGEIELTRFAGPLSDVARSAAEGRVADATQAARNFAELALARYAWVSSRRWLVASITGLIASIAALAGSALLFEQNKLLRSQSALLQEQNNRIGEQTDLLLGQNRLTYSQILLADAAQVNEVITPEVVRIGEQLGQEREAYLSSGGDIGEFGLKDISSGTRSRIVATTLAARPYRYLAPDYPNTHDDQSLLTLALRRRPDILNAGVELAEPERVEVETSGAPLIDRATSPQRGSLLRVLISMSILDTELLSFNGADFSFAELGREVLPGVSLRHASLSFADFSWTRVIGCGFGAARLGQARFEHGVVRQTDFSAIPGDEVEFPYDGTGMDFLRTFMPGASFSSSVVFETDFDGVQGLVMNFDDAVVAMSTFRDASIGGTTFRNAIIVETDFEGAELQSLDLDGALVFEEDFIETLAAAAVPGTFVAERWRLEPADPGDVPAHPGYIEMTNHLPESAYDGRQAWRVVRAQTGANG